MTPITTQNGQPGLILDERLSDLLPAAVYVCEPSGMIRYYNRRAVELWGREPQCGDTDERFCGAFKLYFPDGRFMAHASTPMAETLRTGQPQRNREAIIERPDGSRITVMVNIDPLCDGDGALVGAVNVFQDISERKQAEEAKGLLAAIVESSDDAIIGETLNGSITSWNAGAERLYGYTAGEVVGQPISLLFPPEREDELPDILQRLQRGERIENHETTRLCRDGRRIDVSVTISPIRDRAGRITGASAIARDISGRKLVEQKLRMQARVLESMAEGVSLSDESGTILYTNPAEDRMFGYQPGELIGQHVSLLNAYPPAENTRVVAEVIDQLRTKGDWFGEFRNRRKDGTAFTSFARITVLELDAKKHWVCVQEDITEGKRAEQELRASRLALERKAKDLETILDAVPAAVWIAHDRDSRRIAGNAAAAELLRLSPGMNQSMSAPDGDRPTNFRVIAEGVELPPDQLPVQRAARGDTLRDFEEQIVFFDGSSRYVVGNASPLLDDEGQPRGAVAAFVDITERKQLEQELLRTVEELADADRRKDEFLAMLAHELRNPLAPIRSGLDLLAMTGVEHESLELMQEQVEHLVRLVDDLLDVSRIMRGRIQLRKEPVQLADAVQRAIEAVRSLIDGPGHTLTISTPSRPVWVEADPVRLAQIISNLLGNAAKYTEPGGQIWLTLTQVGDDAVLSVRDTGVGISQDLLPRVFDLFTQADRSLERSQGGLGIGLTLVRSLVEMHGGTVSVQSEGEGQGAEFIVRLPALAQVEHQSPMSQTIGPTRARRVLIVDDNAAVTKMTRLLFAKLGDHEVEMAYDGPSALKIAATCRPDVVLLDIGLPRMNGYEVAQRLREQPEFRDTLLVALTGYGTEDDRRRSLDAGFDLHLVKPPSVESLHEILAHPRLPA